MLKLPTVSVSAVPVSKIPPATVTMVSPSTSLEPRSKVPKFIRMPPVVASVLEILTVPVLPLEPTAIALLLVVQVFVKSTVPPVAACKVVV